jgi:TIR domain
MLVGPTADRSEIAEVFVSYSSEDRDRVLPLVDSLISRGIPVWIDRYRIPAARRWASEISRAIKAAKVVVFFASSSAFSSSTVLQEVGFACEKKKLLLPLYLEEFEIPEEFELFLTGIHVIRLHEALPEAWPEKTCGSLRKLGVTVPPRDPRGGPEIPGAEFGPTTPPASSAAISPLTPYLVNRTTQNGELRTTVGNHFLESRNLGKSPSVPLVLIAYGRRDQALLEYCQTLEEVYMPKALKYVGYPDCMILKYLPWVKDSDDERAVSGFRSEIEFQLDLKPGSMWETLGRKVAQLRSAVVLCYHQDCSAWTEAQFRALRYYIQSWAGLPGISSSYPLVILFVFQYQAMEAKWQDWFNLRRPKHSPIANQLLALRDLKGPSLDLNVLTELGNVTSGDIDHWIRTEVKPPDPAGMIRKVGEILDDRDLYDGESVSMSVLVERLHSVGVPMSDLIALLRRVLEITVKEQLN